jgi:hypothetical protein
VASAIQNGTCRSRWRLAFPPVAESVTRQLGVVDPQIKNEWFMPVARGVAPLRPMRKAIRPILDLDHRPRQKIIREIGSRLHDMLSRGKVALPPRPERLLQALDDQERSHSRGSSGGDRSN